MGHTTNRLRHVNDVNKTRNSKQLDEVKGRSVVQNTSEMPSRMLPCKIYATEMFRDRDTEVLPRSLTNKACSYAPESQDFAQLTKGSLGPSPEPGNSIHDQYKKLLLEQYGFDPFNPVTAKLLRQVLCNASPKVENSSQCANPDMITNYTDTLESPWHCVDSTEDVDQYLASKPQPPRQCNYSQILGQSTPISKRFFSNSTPISTPILSFSRQRPTPQEVSVRDEPRIKVIVEKYTRYKKKNLEIRQLQEKIVCVEYDVYITDDDTKPVQTMRSFFSVSNECYKCGDKDIPLNGVPSEFRKKYNITEQNLKEVTNEIEIIDSNVPGNKTYLEDLKKLLKKQGEIRTKKNAPSLDLKAMYNMAKRDCPSFDHDFSSTNLLSKAELEEIKELLKKSISANLKINKKIVNPKSSQFHLCQLSESILAACI
ncbi:uncharacterized protein LOC113229489 [Hyposmocoma kahamanoa]|uniref:uncharacterized protein LOC113229489 n=1 Tax=Hyposmocoma kahamanoa TaxID=1477025 RepID=UPI000E6D81FF|nr:uncharacterized protein LOC113229489 [Hyposmocoma kahamanoa]